jgi:hypothetical protein
LGHVSRRLRGPGLAAIALTVSAGSLAVVFGLTAGDASSSERAGANRLIDSRRAVTLATVDPTTTQRVPLSFLGVSAEYQSVPMWAHGGRAVYRMLALLRPREGGPLLVRVGGDSADRTVWDLDDPTAPRWSVRLTPLWLRSTRSLVRHTGARLMLDLNLVTGTPRDAARWAGAAEHALPRGSIAALEIGNEPDIYDRHAWLANTLRARRDGSLIPREITSGGYDRAFRAYALALGRVAPGVPLAGPELAHPAVDTDWVARLLAAPHPGLGIVTTHIYPLSACAGPGWRRYPTVARVLSPRSAAARARAVRAAVRLAHRAGLIYRVTELNSVTCGGLPGVSNSFATALWAPQVLFELLRAGVDGANLHVRPDKINAPFALRGDRVTARPLLYGLILFERTLGAAARLVPVRLSGSHGSRLEAWAVRVGSRGLHVLLINPGARPHTVAVRVPAVGRATVQRLRAPALDATTGVTLGGRRLGADGRWRGRIIDETVEPRGGEYDIAVPGASAALVAVRLASAGGANV